MLFQNRVLLAVVSIGRFDENKLWIQLAQASFESLTSSVEGAWPPGPRKFKEQMKHFDTHLGSEI